MPTHRLLTWPAPPDEAPSPDYTLTVEEQPVFVYRARVRAEILQHDGLWTHVAGPPGARASFALFDCDGPVTVSVRPARPFRAAAVLPARAGIAPEIDGEVIRFTVPSPQHLTLVLDGGDALPLHLFIGAPETDIPDPDDPNVIYFGPGVHETHGLALPSGATVYLAGGAILRAVLPPDAQGEYSEQWKVTFHPGSVFNVKDAENITIRGRGIVDAAHIPHPGWTMVSLTGSHGVCIEGITLRDAANWNMTLRASRDVTVEDVRIISGRLNSDGINSVNARGVRIRRCFVRNHDDSIVVKTLEPEMPAEDILVEDCRVWNDWGYALGVSYETRSPIRHITFRRCDVLYAQHWCLGVHLSDSATVSDVTFADIGIAALDRGPRPSGADALSGEPKLLRLSISPDIWGKDGAPGRIRDVTVDGVTVHGAKIPPVEMYGYDAEHDIRGVTLRGIRRHGQAPAEPEIVMNVHVHEVRSER